MLNNRQQRLEGFKPSKRYNILKINFLTSIFCIITFGGFETLQTLLSIYLTSTPYFLNFPNT